MGVKKYTAATMQKALKNIREDLGDDAIILSNRKLPNGQVEITVSLEDEQSLAKVSESKAIAPTHHEPNRYSQGPTVEPLSLSNEKAKQLLAAVRTSQQSSGYQQSNSPVATPQLDQRDYAQQAAQLQMQANQAHMQAASGIVSQPIASQPTLSPDMSTFFQTTVLQMQQEISELRRQVSSQETAEPKQVIEKRTPEASVVPTTSPNLRALAVVTKKWRQIGLDDSILKAFYKTNAFKAVEAEKEQVLWSACMKNLKSHIPRYSRNAIESPGVYAFVGPTGAGKTTTLGKLAVRQVNRWGADNVGIVTMDSFRIGAWEQMQRLGDIIGVKTALCRQEDSLMDTLAEMRDCRFILIDTAGLSHQDERRIAQWEKLDELGDELETYLVAQANLQSNVLQQLTKAYKPARIRGMIYTKCDEATSLGEAISALVHAELPWVFACDGQRIPEDLKVMSVDAVLQMLVTTAKQKRWDLGGHASEQETLLVKAMG